MSQFYPYETIDYTYTINKALQRIFEARARVHDSVTYEEYLSTVKALVVILVPRLRPRGIDELFEKAEKRDPVYGFYTQESLQALDKIVELVVDTLDANRLLIKGESYEEERM